MRRSIISRWLWWTFAWSAAIALVLGFNFEMNYRDRVASLPVLVDIHGNRASLETAQAALDLYVKAKQIHKFGYVSLGIGAVLLICAAATKRDEPPGAKQVA